MVEITVSQGLVPTDKLARGSLLSEIVPPHPGGKRGRENEEGGGTGRDRDRDRDRGGRRAEESGRRREGAREEGGRGKRSGKDKEGKGEGGKGRGRERLCLSDGGLLSELST